MPRIVIEKGKDKGKALRLKENGVYLVGRDIKTNLRLTDLQTSRRHFKVTCRLGEFRLEDLDSSNGTYVNGRRVRTAALESGDKVEVGETVLFFLEDEEEQAVRKGDLTGREAGGYRIGRLLGRGGMGTVYEAIQISLERKVAFKVLAKELAADEQFIERFAAEARSAGSLNHPNIVQVYDVGFAPVAGLAGPGVRYYSMEYMARGSVDDLLRQEGRLSFARALPILFDAARGLEYAERHGVVHRDIKPQNLFISDEGIVKIGDLGIAQRRRHEDDAKDGGHGGPPHQAEREDSVSGSPHYMAPEQARGGPIDGRADLYALGVSLYELLSGEPPFDGASAREVILKHLNEAPPPLGEKANDAPAEALELVERLMAKDPEERLPSARHLLAELVSLARRCELPSDTRIRIEAAIGGAPELASPPSGPVDPRAETTDMKPEPGPSALATTAPSLRPKRFGRLAVAALLLVVVAALAGLSGFLLVRSIGRSREERRRTAEEQVARLRERLEGTALVDETEIAAARRDVQAPLEAAGYQDLAATARQVIDGAAREAEKRARTKAADAARAALAELKQRVAKLRDAKPATVENAQRLLGAAKDLEKLAEKAPAGAADEALPLAREVAAEAKRTLEAIEAKKQREASAEQAFNAKLSAIASLVGQRRYRDARLHVDELSSAWKDLESTPERAQRLSAAIERAARDDLTKQRAEARRFIETKSWDDARRALKHLRAELDEGPVSREVQDALGEIDKAEKAASERESSRAADADKPRYDTALNAAAPLAARRRFADAAKELEAVRPLLSADPVIRRLDRRVRSLKAAQEAIERVGRRIRTRGRDSGIRHSFVADLAAWPAVGLEGDVVTFEFSRGVLRTLRLAEIPIDELHGWVKLTIEGKADAEGHLDAAALLVELDKPEDARGEIARARTALGERQPDPKLAALLVELEEAAGDE